MQFPPSGRHARKTNDRCNMIALGHPHRSAGLRLADLDPAPPKNLDEHHHRCPAAVIHGGAGPVENHGPRLNKFSRHWITPFCLSYSDSHLRQARSATPKASVIPAPPVPVQIETPGMG